MRNRISRVSFYRGTGREKMKADPRSGLSLQSYARAVRLALAMLALLTGLALVIVNPTSGQQNSNGPVLVFDVKGVIGFTSVEHLQRSVERAKAENASLIIMRIDTPGGLVSSTRDMIQTSLHPLFRSLIMLRLAERVRRARALI